MKKTRLLSLLIPLVFSNLASCGSSSTPKQLTYGTMITQEVTALKELSNTELFDKGYNEEETFILAAYQGEYSKDCTCWDPFKNLITTYMNRYHECIYLFDAQAQDDDASGFKIRKLQSSTLYVYVFKGHKKLAEFANNNLYRILGIAMLAISIYPFILKPDFIKKSHGAIIAFVGLIFLARGFVDLDSAITNVYDVVFAYFDFPIAVIALVLILFVIIQIFLSARGYQDEFSRVKREGSNERVKRVHNPKSKTFNYEEKMHRKPNRTKRVVKSEPESKVQFNDKIGNEKQESGINESTSKIHFESNDLLDDFKK